MEKNFDFYERMKVVGAYIPYGKVVTYGQLALLCQKPINARQAGFALRKNKAGKGFPAHRVVNASGYLSGAGAFDLPGQQKRMLMDEGVRVSMENRVDLRIYGWKNTMEDAYFFKELFAIKNV